MRRQDSLRFWKGREPRAMSSSSPPEEDKKRMWIKYYCEECKAWETRELFEANLLSSHGVVVPGAEAASSSSPAAAVTSSSALWSWGCAKLIHHGAFQTFRVNQLNVDAELGHDDASPKHDVPSLESPATQPPPGQLEVSSTIASNLALSFRFIFLKIYGTLH